MSVLLDRLREAATPIRLALWRRTSVGRGSYIDPTVQLIGARNVRVGSDCVIGEGSWINVNHRTAHEARISIGDKSLIGRRNFISSGASIDIAPFCLTGADCSFVGADHVTHDPTTPYAATGATDVAVISVGANCWFGGGALVLGNVAIGMGSVIGARSVILRDIPPFSVVVGTPARVIRRFGFAQREWVDIVSFTEEDEASIPEVAAYLAQLKTNAAEFKLPRKAAGYRRGHIY